MFYAKLVYTGVYKHLIKFKNIYKRINGNLDFLATLINLNSNSEDRKYDTKTSIPVFII